MQAAAERKRAQRGWRQRALPVSRASLEEAQRGGVGHAPGSGCINQPGRVRPELQSRERVKREAGANPGRALNARPRTQIYLEDGEEPCEVFSRSVPSKRWYFQKNPGYLLGIVTGGEKRNNVQGAEVPLSAPCRQASVCVPGQHWHHWELSAVQPPSRAQ